MMSYNGIECNTIEELELLISDLTEEQKENVRNDFLGIDSTPVFGPPKEVTNQQLRQALILKSFNESRPELHPESIKVFLNTLAEPLKSIAINFWEYSNMMQRNNEVLNQLSPILGLSSEDVDNLFMQAIDL